MSRDVVRQREKQRQWARADYHANPEKYRIRDQKRHRALISLVSSYKTRCSRCGFSNPKALDFHHREPSQKKFTIGNATRDKIDPKRLIAEIQKCDVLCANCHRILTY